jgi:hypothetical protein
MWTHLSRRRRRARPLRAAGDEGAARPLSAAATPPYPHLCVRSSYASEGRAHAARRGWARRARRVRSQGGRHKREVNGGGEPEG